MMSSGTSTKGSRKNTFPVSGVEAPTCSDPCAASVQWVLRAWPYL